MDRSAGSHYQPLLPTRALVELVRLYQRLVSPVFPQCCRYYPSCSEYAVQALLRHGLARGAVLASARLLRCHPWTDGGMDPVPERRG
jgi:putative membrane protein insertion efficiency factor